MAGPGDLSIPTNYEMIFLGETQMTNNQRSCIPDQFDPDYTTDQLWAVPATAPPATAPPATAPPATAPLEQASTRPRRQSSEPALLEWMAALFGLAALIGAFALWSIKFEAGPNTATAAALIPPAPVPAIQPLASGDEDSETDAAVAEPPTTTTPTTAPTTTRRPFPEFASLVADQVASRDVCGSGNAPLAVEVAGLGGDSFAVVVACQPGNSSVMQVVESASDWTLAPVVIELLSQSGLVSEHSSALQGEVTINPGGHLTVLQLSPDSNDASLTCGIKQETEWNGSRFELRRASGYLDCETILQDEPNDQAQPQAEPEKEWPLLFPLR